MWPPFPPAYSSIALHLGALSAHSPLQHTGVLLLLNIDSRENHVALQYEHLTFLVNRCASTGSEGFCSDKVCAGIHDAEECQDHNSGGLSCSWSTVVNSAPGRCTVAGYALPCNMLSGADQCASGGGSGGGGSSGGGQTRECIWNADYYMCQDKSVLDRECHTFTPATCPITDGSKCEVVVRAASGYRVCQVKKALEPRHAAANQRRWRWHRQRRP